MCRILLFFFNDTATTEIYTLSLHDALPISGADQRENARHLGRGPTGKPARAGFHQGPLREAGHAVEQQPRDRKSTRLNSSHANISYAVFCLKKKNNYSQLHLTQDLSSMPPL